MTESNYKSAESSRTKRLNTEQSEEFEAYRNELHREIAAKWPIVNDVSEIKPAKSTISKSNSYSNTRLRHKSTLTFVDNERSRSQLSHLASTNPTGSNRKKSGDDNHTLANNSEPPLDDYQQNVDWNSKSQQGIITYQLPDSLPDGLALCNKLQTLINSNTIHLNDRQFWNNLEDRFKVLRKKTFRETMERLRRNQQEYEQELIVKGILPYTTEEAIRKHAEEQRTKSITNNYDMNLSHHQKKCTIDYNPTDEFSVKNEGFESFDSDNVHPRLHELFHDYQFQTKLGQELGEDLQTDLLKSQAKLKTIFPKINQQDRIRQELEVVKTSEGLYSYSNRLAKHASK